MSIPAGAAGRGERNGWTGDAAFGSESECFDFGTGAFYSKYLEQVVDQQGPVPIGKGGKVNGAGHVLDFVSSSTRAEGPRGGASYVRMSK